MNVNNNVYQEQTTHKAKWTTLQTSMVSIGLLVAALGLLAIFVIGLIIKYGILTDNVLANASTINVLYTVSGITGMVAIIMYFIWAFKPNMSFGMQIATISIYCLSFGITFGILFTVFDIVYIIYCFGITALVLIMCYGISRITSQKVAFGIQKILMVFFVIYLIATFVIMILTLVNPLLMANFFGGTSFAGSWTYFVIQIIFGIVSFLIIWYSLYQLKTMDSFRENLDPKFARSIAMLIGFNILINLVAILRLFLYLFLNKN